MTRDNWRPRLAQAIIDADTTGTAASRKAGQLCDALNVDPMYIMFGYPVDQQTRELLDILKSYPEKVEPLLSLLRAERGT